MNLAFDFRRGLQTLPNVLDALVARINTVWRKQHKDDGSHGNVTASSMTVTGPALTGPLRVESKDQGLPVIPDGSGRTSLDIHQSTNPVESRIVARKARTIPPSSLDSDTTDLRIRANVTRFQRAPGMVEINNPIGAITCTPELGSMTAGLFNGNVGVGGSLGVNSIIQANGGQIQFPAVQIPSGSPNTLDDYEEGAWVPAWRFAGGGTPTYSAQHGYYVKVGRLLIAEWRLITTSMGGAAGIAFVGGLPFTLGGAIVGGHGMATYYAGMIAIGPPIAFFLAAPPADMAGLVSGATGVANLAAGNFSAATDVMGIFWAYTVT